MPKVQVHNDPKVTRLPQVSRLSVITELIQRRANRWACPGQSRILATFLESPLSDESTVGEIAARARRKDSGINSRRGGGPLFYAHCGLILSEWTLIQDYL